MSLHIDKENNPSREDTNYKHIHMECWHTQVHKTNTPGYKGTHRPPNNNSE
jgi:hypothetical protein